MKGKSHVLEVWGDLACFTRPEAKVERLSYPVATPSAARGIFDAIYWKPDEDFYWQVERIEILRLPRFLALRRNEVKNKADGESTILSWANGKAEPEPLYADATGEEAKGRTQRQTMALKNVHYRITAAMCSRRGRGLSAQDAQFERRARQGKCIYQPYFGCREFPAYFSLELSANEAVPLDMDLGWMLYDVFDLGNAGHNRSTPSISLFHAVIRQGVLEIPDYSDSRVRKAQVVA
ncbi:type I-C CRISPR-associated protein Cas5 [bacterium]|nr:type I-C CRISPR-associated protein Cas5 [bacterium]